MEPELASLETSEMVLVQEDHSENHSSTSDIIHIEAELHERVESDDDEDLRSSEIIRHESDLMPPQTVELLCVEETSAEMISEPVFTHTPLMSEPLDFTLASVPIPEIISRVLDPLPTSTASRSSESSAPDVSPDHTAPPSEQAVSKANPPSSAPFELPVLLVGGAALVAILGVLTYTLRTK